jgi:hypothetical protein
VCMRARDGACVCAQANGWSANDLGGNARTFKT